MPHLVGHALACPNSHPYLRTRVSSDKSFGASVPLPEETAGLAREPEAKLTAVFFFHKR